MQNKADAKAIATDLLDRTGDAMDSGDFDAFAACFDLPTTTQTFEGERTFSTLQDLQAMFDDVRRAYARMGNPQRIRHCVEAHLRDPETIETTHETRELKHGTFVRQPYPVFSVLKLVEGEWRIKSSQYALTEHPEIAQILGKTKHPG